MNLKSIKELSIQISLSGLSFCILNRSESKIEFLKSFDFKEKLTPETLLEKLQNIVLEESLLSASFDNILVLFQNELSSFVPEALFDENNAADYLKFSSKILRTDFISHDKIVENNSINVFVPYMNINNFLFETYGEFEYKHVSSILLQHLLKTDKSASVDKMHINVESMHFEMVVLKKGQLQLYNSFNYTTKEDFIYYVLFVIEQLDLNPESMTVQLSGHIHKDDALYRLLYNYIRNVEIDLRTYPFSFDVEKPQSLHKFSILLNSFL